MSRAAAVWGVILVLLGTELGRAAEPSQETVLYTALRPAGWDLYLFESSGSDPRRLTRDPALDYDSALSPDGRWAVFCSERRGNPDLFVLDLQAPETPQLLLETPAMEAAAAFSPDGTQLAFVGTRSGNADIFVVDFSPEDGRVTSEPVNLTRHPGGDFRPAFSPDGRRIAFSSNRDEPGAGEIYVMKADGTDVQRLTEASGWDGSPVWSPDGDSLHFYSERDGQPRLYRMASDGSGQEAVTPPGERALSPAWTPEGRLAYVTRIDGRWQIVSIEPDGSDRRQETDGRHDYWAPAYAAQEGSMVCHGSTPVPEEEVFQSGTPGPFLVNDQHEVELPDRRLRVCAIRGYFPDVHPATGEVASDEGFRRIVISRLDGSDMRTLFDPKEGRTWRPTWGTQRLASSVGPTFANPAENVDIWKLRSDGRGAKNLTADSDANDAFPDFSADGRRIVFRSGRDGDHDIYLMQADGSGVRQLTDHEATDTMPAFAPDGERIAFVSDRTGDYEVYVLELQGDGQAGDVRRITHSPGRDTHPKFSPDGKWIVFASQRGGLNDETPLIPVFNPQPYGEIFALRLADGHTVRLTHNKWEDGTPTWSR